MEPLLADHDDATCVTQLCQDLIRFDTSNFGDNAGPVEAECAEHIASLLTDAGLDPQVVDSSTGRLNVVARIAGTDPAPGEALLIHGHTDVVPASAADWDADPFCGDVIDGAVWGRGAVDMKGMDAMTLALVLDMAKAGVRPRNDLVVAFFADEEAGSVYGSHHVVDHHAELFDGVGMAISEVGGFSQTIDGHRFYLLQAAEKGIMWLRLVAQGRAGHGSQVGTDNAVTRLCAAVTRIGEHRWPITITPTVRAFLDQVEEITGVPLDHTDFDELTRRLHTTARWVGATLQNTSNPTVLDAGYKHNVIPGSASALVDCRFLPGARDELLATITELAGDRVDVQIVHEDVSLEADIDTAFTAAMTRAVLAEDPDAHVAPYCLSGGTDNKALSKLRIPGYGFAPLRLPEGLDFAGMFHGINERVPTESLAFGRRVLERLVFADTGESA